MSTYNTIKKDLSSAMKARDSKVVSSLRMVLSEIQYASIGGEVTEDIVQSSLKRYRKKLLQTLQHDPSAKDEMEIVDNYLPKQATKEDILVAISKFKDAGLKPGPMTGKVIKELNGQVDSKMVAELVKEASL